MGKQVRDEIMQTGGLAVRKGKALKKKKKGGTAVELMAKMHVVKPVMEGMILHPHLCDLLLNYAV